MPAWLEEFLGDVTLLQAVAWVAIAVTGIVGAVKLWPILRKAIALTDSLAELPQFMADTKQKLDDIHHETHKNDGTSIKDATGRLEEAVERVELGVKALYDRTDELTRADADLRRDIEDTRPHPSTGVPTQEEKQ